MSERHRVALREEPRGPHPDQVRDGFLRVLSPVRATAPDETGIFEVEVEAPSWDAALLAVIDAVAASGAEDHLLVAEHPEIPEHWRRLRG
jgi:hypothetical protein